MCSEPLVSDTIDQQGAPLINGVEGWIGRPAYTIHPRIVILISGVLLVILIHCGTFQPVLSKV
jgi:hypothetical protein